jgi:hypothetical protein
MKESVAQFIASCGQGYEYPSGGNVELLAPSEERIYVFLRDEAIATADKIRAMSEGLRPLDGYRIVTLGVRLAVLGVRNSSREAYKCGVVALIAGCPQIDWRDALGVFSMFECCGNRMKISFQDELSRTVKYGDEGKLSRTIEGFFSRTDEMRGVDVMGFIEIGSGNTWTFAAMDPLS